MWNIYDISMIGSHRKFYLNIHSRIISFILVSVLYFMGRVPAWNSTSSLGMFTEKLCLLFVIEHMVLSFLWCDEVDWGLGKYWKILKAVKLSFRNTVKLQYVIYNKKDETEKLFYRIRFNAVILHFPQNFLFSPLTLVSELLVKLLAKVLAKY